MPSLQGQGSPCQVNYCQIKNVPSSPGQEDTCGEEKEQEEGEELSVELSSWLSSITKVFEYKISEKSLNVLNE